MTILVLFLAVSFLIYGYNCLFTVNMRSEFNRFGLTELQRKLTGALQIAGAIGLFLSFRYPTLGVLASGGLTLLMFLGFLVRLRIKDSFMKSFPSFAFMVLNGFLFWQFLSVFS